MGVLANHIESAKSSIETHGDLGILHFRTPYQLSELSQMIPDQTKSKTLGIQQTSLFPYISYIYFNGGLVTRIY